MQAQSWQHPEPARTPCQDRSCDLQEEMERNLTSKQRELNKDALIVFCNYWASDVNYKQDSAALYIFTEGQNQLSRHKRSCKFCPEVPEHRGAEIRSPFMSSSHLGWPSKQKHFKTLNSSFSLCYPNTTSAPQPVLAS